MSGVSMKSHVWRARWAAVGAAVAVTLGAGGMLVVNAEPVDQQTGELEFVAIAPARFFDSRTDAREGGTRPFYDGETEQLDFSEFLYGTGTLPTPSANIVGAVVLNVTAANQQMRGFLSVNPSLCFIDGDDDCPGPGFPETSNINWDEGGANIANQVTVILGEWDTDVSGLIDITMEGNSLPPSSSDEVADVIVDVVGYYVTDAPRD
jgi:hypothetical protein